MRDLEKPLAFYGFKEQPFGVTPDPRFLYLSRSHREALSSLFYATEARRGFSALIAEPGMGKTTLLFHMLNDIKDHARTAFLFQPESTAPEFMTNLLDDLGIHYQNGGAVSLQRLLNETLLDEMRGGKHFVLVVDEAQSLDNSVLERIRLLSNFETPAAKLIHIILSGQPELGERLADPKLAQLKQRVSVVSRLEPFSLSETIDYVHHRLRLAGYGGAPLFTSSALGLIDECSRGIPRNINSLCFLALSLGFAKQERLIDFDTVQEAADDAWLNPPAAPPRTEAVPTRASLALSEANEIHFSSFGPEQKPLKTSLVMLGLLIVPLLVIALAGNQQIESILNGLVAGLTAQPDASMLNSPAVLRPPPPPEIEKVAETAQTMETQTPSSAATDSPNQGTRMVQQPGKKNGRNLRKRRNVHHGAERIRADRQETLFELALAHYGKSNWDIVEEICAANPNLRCPYGLVHPGQQVLLPDLSPKYPLLSASLDSSTGYAEQDSRLGR